VRDLGGLPVVGGGRTRAGAIVRADVLGRLTEKGKRQLLDYGVGTIIDLRAPQEIAEVPPAVFAGDGRAPVYRNPRAQQQLPFVKSQMQGATTRAELYRLGIDHYPLNQVRLVRAVANAGPGGIVIHCHSGKDRTGIAAAILLSLAGVEKEAIADDYAITQARLWPFYEQQLAEGKIDEESDPWAVPVTEPKTMLDLLDHLQSRWGGAEAYLLRAGQTRKEIESVRTRLAGWSAGQLVR
jgi:protein tyrosine/serine phosphatase